MEFGFEFEWLFVVKRIASSDNRMHGIGKKTLTFIFNRSHLNPPLACIHRAWIINASTQHIIYSRIHFRCEKFISLLIFSVSVSHRHARTHKIPCNPITMENVVRKRMRIKSSFNCINENAFYPILFCISLVNVQHHSDSLQKWRHNVDNDNSENIHKFSFAIKYLTTTP